MLMMNQFIDITNKVIEQKLAQKKSQGIDLYLISIDYGFPLMVFTLRVVIGNKNSHTRIPFTGYFRYLDDTDKLSVTFAKFVDKQLEEMK